MYDDTATDNFLPVDNEAAKKDNEEDLNDKVVSLSTSQSSERVIDSRQAASSSKRLFPFFAMILSGLVTVAFLSGVPQEGLY
jgi:hypothetical protein